MIFVFLAVLLTATEALSFPAVKQETDNVFTVIIQPDTQYQMLSEAHAQSWYKAAQWVCENRGRDALDIRALLTLGDLVDSGDDAEQWERWKRGADMLADCEVPILSTVGNHDFPCNPENSGCSPRGIESNYVDDAPLFLDNTTPYMEDLARPWWQDRGPLINDSECATDASTTSRVSWIQFHPKWAAIALPWNDGDNASGNSPLTTCEAQWAWASSTIGARTDLNWIAVNHRFVNTSGVAFGDLGALLDARTNIVIAAGGHWGATTRFVPATRTHASVDRAVLYANWQISTISHSYFGYLVIVTIDGDAGEVCFRSYSPIQNAYDAQGVAESCHTVTIQ